MVTRATVTDVIPQPTLLSGDLFALAVNRQQTHPFVERPESVTRMRYVTSTKSMNLVNDSIHHRVYRDRYVTPTGQAVPLVERDTYTPAPRVVGPTCVTQTVNFP